jgi:hypothetical protein
MPDFIPDIDSVCEPGDAAAAHDMANFTLGPREVICPTCWLIHQPGRCPNAD